MTQPLSAPPAGFSPTICLTIAGSDPSGGAGLQADLKTFAAHGVYGASVISLVTAQNTQGVQGVETLSSALIEAQLRSVFSDLQVHAVKIGALLDAEVMRTVARGLREWSRAPLVLDPVMVSKHGHALIDDAAAQVLIDTLVPLASVLTPNRHEAKILGDWTGSLDDEEAGVLAERIYARFQKPVVVTGGSSESDEIVDWYVSAEGRTRLAHPRVEGAHRHGAGCSLAAAIAAHLGRDFQARGALPEDAVIAQAVRDARAWVRRAMEVAPTVGHGEGPIWHNVSTTR